MSCVYGRGLTWPGGICGVLGTWVGSLVDCVQIPAVAVVLSAEGKTVGKVAGRRLVDVIAGPQRAESAALCLSHNSKSAT